MNINSLYGNVATSPTPCVDGVNPSTSGSGSIAPAAAGAASATISSPAQFLSEMQQLSQQNPAQFKAVAAQVATSFQTAASQATGPEAKVLTGLANQFSQAAQTGSLQASAGAQGPGQGAPAAAQGASAGQNEPHHHHHHHGGGGGGGTSSALNQAFQSAMSILTQTTAATSAAGSTTDPSASSTSST